MVAPRKASSETSRPAVFAVLAAACSALAAVRTPTKDCDINVILPRMCRIWSRQVRATRAACQAPKEHSPKKTGATKEHVLDHQLDKDALPLDDSDRLRDGIVDAVSLLSVPPLHLRGPCASRISLAMRRSDFVSVAFTRTDGPLGGGAWEFGCRTDMAVSRPDPAARAPDRVNAMCFRYLPVGTLRRSSSNKFSRETTWFCVSCAPLAPEAGISVTMRVPSGARQSPATHSACGGLRLPWVHARAICGNDVRQYRPAPRRSVMR